MSLPLTKDERAKVAKILTVLFGVSNAAPYEHKININTVNALEIALLAMKECDKGMKELVEGLVGAGFTLSRGWLRKILDRLYSDISNDKIRFSGAGCRFAGAAQHKSAILMTIQF